MSLQAAVPLWAKAQHTSDLDQHALAQSNWTLDYQQLSPGRWQGHLVQIQLPEVVLLREDTWPATHQRGRIDDRLFGFAMSLHPRTDLIFHGQRVPEHGMLVGRGNALDLITPAQFTLMALLVDQSLIEPLWQRMYHRPLASWLEQHRVLVTTEPKAQALREHHIRVMNELMGLAQQSLPERTALTLRDELLMEWIEALPARVSPDESPHLVRKRQLLAKACELMTHHSETPLSVEALCQEIGTSRRTLNYVFQDLMGLSPARYQRALRLNAVRRALRQAKPGTTVQDVATEWGFWHLGQFARDYRQLFGEKPSATLGE